MLCIAACCAFQTLIAAEFKGECSKLPSSFPGSSFTDQDIVTSGIRAHVGPRTQASRTRRERERVRESEREREFVS